MLPGVDPGVGVACLEPTGDMRREARLAAQVQPVDMRDQFGCGTVMLGEIVDDAAVPPARDTLLWYRLACALPDALPASSTRAMAMLDAEAARRDYRLVVESLGRCGRTL